MTAPRPVPLIVTTTPEAIARAEAEFEQVMGFPAAEARDRIDADLRRALSETKWADHSVPMTDEQIGDGERAANALLGVMRDAVITGGQRRIREREARMRAITDDMLAQARAAGVIP